MISSPYCLLLKSIKKILKLFFTQYCTNIPATFFLIRFDGIRICRLIDSWILWWWNPHERMSSFLFSSPSHYPYPFLSLSPLFSQLCNIICLYYFKRLLQVSLSWTKRSNQELFLIWFTHDCALFSYLITKSVTPSVHDFPGFSILCFAYVYSEGIGFKFSIFPI